RGGAARGGAARRGSAALRGGAGARRGKRRRGKRRRGGGAVPLGIASPPRRWDNVLREGQIAGAG
ncbi:hypothetical protein MTF65_29450, partial [Streptomyces sp. APSN-46.1]|uniref:hypothetical protein n=1 Tax=Streptomyces sp. APSN-46.1 TaxID=2929049 RepID=UPI001FB4EE71